MKTDNLRIGNLVLPVNSDKYEKVNRITEDSINTWSSDLFKSITINGEILKKFGFEKVKNTFYQYRIRENCTDVFALLIKVEEGKVLSLRGLETVDFLQNFWFYNVDGYNLVLQD
jgi:hypothetical protein